MTTDGLERVLERERQHGSADRGAPRDQLPAQPVAQVMEDEPERLDAVDGPLRLELGAQPLHGSPGSQRPGIEAVRQVVERAAMRPEARHHRGARQPGEVPDMRQPEPSQAAQGVRVRGQAADGLRRQPGTLGRSVAHGDDLSERRGHLRPEPGVADARTGDPRQQRAGEGDGTLDDGRLVPPQPVEPLDAQQHPPECRVVRVAGALHRRGDREQRLERDLHRPAIPVAVRLEEQRVGHQRMRRPERLSPDHPGTQRGRAGVKDGARVPRPSTQHDEVGPDGHVVLQQERQMVPAEVEEAHVGWVDDRARWAGDG